MAETRCAEAYRPYYDRHAEPVPCFREVDENRRHRGKHQGWTEGRLVSWDEAGSQTRRGGIDYSAYAPCTSCGTLVPPAEDGGIMMPGHPDAYGVGMENVEGVCYSCRIWDQRIKAHAEGWQEERPRHGRRKRTRTIRFHEGQGWSPDRLYMWSEGITGAFGDRAVTVQWDDGDTAGPASSMWDSGAIPWWLVEQLPPNAKLVRP